jgi:hypothetical protein
MNSSKILSIVIATIAAALVMSSIHSANYVFAKKDDSSSSGSGGSDNGSSGSSGGTSGSSSSSSSKNDYDTFQKCLSDAASGGSATKQQIKDCFSSSYGGSSTGSSSGGSSDSGNTDNSGSSSDSGQQ